MVDAAGFIENLKRFTPSRKGIHPTKSLAEQIQGALAQTGGFAVHDKIERVIIAGAGANAIAADLVKSYIKDARLDLSVSRGFNLSESANRSTLVIIASFSGEEPEPLSCYRQALKLGCKTVGIMSGGRLLETFAKSGSERILSQGDPEYSMYLVSASILRLLANSGLIKPQDTSISEAVQSMTKPELETMGKQLSQKLAGTVPVIFCSQRLKSVAEYWKYRLNSIVKMHAFFNVFSDAAYSDLDSYVNKNQFYTVFLGDEEDSPEAQKSMLVAKRIIRDRGHPTTELLIKGSGLLTRLYTACRIGDIACAELADGKKESLLDQYLEEFRGV
jgi:glucose/mannose-6-phosphate isomerase